MRMRDLSALKGVDRELELLEKKKCKNVVGSFSSPRKKNELKKKKKKKTALFFFVSKKKSIRETDSKTSHALSAMFVHFLLSRYRSLQVQE